RLGLFPVAGRGGLSHLVLPAVTLAAGGVAATTRLVRAELLEVLGADYIRTARAKGVGPVALVFKHALRNALLPVVTMTGMDLGSLLGGAVVVETVFAWPGLGREAVLAILNLDLPVALGVGLIGDRAGLVTTRAVDLRSLAIDPRVRR